MPAVTHHHPQSVSGHAVAADHDPARGGDVAKLASDLMADDDLGGGQLRRHRVAVAAVGHHRLPRCGAALGDDDGIRLRRHGVQWLRFGDHGDRGPPVCGGPQSGVTPHAGEAIQACLGLLGRGFVGQGAPPALGGGVIDLLHHALAVVTTGRADRHRDAVVLGHPGERGGHPSRARVTHRGHPIEAPHSCAPFQATGDAVEAGDQVRLILTRRQIAAPLSGMRQ